PSSCASIRRFAPSCRTAPGAATRPGTSEVTGLAFCLASRVSDPLAIYGIALGGAGCVASAASAVYFRSQARAAHRQSDVADRVALMESNLQMYARFRETRNQFLKFPSLQEEWRETQPRFAEIFDACGGLDNFIAV